MLPTLVLPNLVHYIQEAKTLRKDKGGGGGEEGEEGEGEGGEGGEGRGEEEGDTNTLGPSQIDNITKDGIQKQAYRQTKLDRHKSCVNFQREHNALCTQAVAPLTQRV